MNKYQEALKKLRKIEQTENTWDENCDVLQELVDKATPKNPRNWKAERRLNGAVEFNCPVCNRLYTERVNFCSSCGQRIDWSEDECCN